MAKKKKRCVHSIKGDLPVVRCVDCGAYIFASDPSLQPARIEPPDDDGRHPDQWGTEW